MENYYKYQQAGYMQGNNLNNSTSTQFFGNYINLNPNAQTLAEKPQNLSASCPIHN